jgi:hypothetical protein
VQVWSFYELEKLGKVVFQVRVKNFKKTNTNHYMPGYLDYTQDYCQIANQTSPAATFAINAMKRLSMEVYEMYMNNILYCPVKTVS